MRNPVVSCLLLMLVTGCDSSCQPIGSCGNFTLSGPLTDTPQAPSQTPAAAAPVQNEREPEPEPEPEHDTLAFVTTEAAETFAVASVRPAGEVRIYRLSATDEDEAPLTVTLTGKVELDSGETPERIDADGEGHALVTLRGGTVAIIDPPSAARIGSAYAVDVAFSNAPVTQGSATAFVDDGDAYLRTADDEAFSRVGGPGITRAVGLADVASEQGMLRVFAIQTELPRMLVFFTTADTTSPVAFEPLE